MVTNISQKTIQQNSTVQIERTLNPVKDIIFGKSAGISKNPANQFLKELLIRKSPEYQSLPSKSLKEKFNKSTVLSLQIHGFKCVKLIPNNHDLVIEIHEPKIIHAKISQFLRDHRHKHMCTKATKRSSKTLDRQYIENIDKKNLEKPDELSIGTFSYNSTTTNDTDNSEIKNLEGDNMPNGFNYDLPNEVSIDRGQCLEDDDILPYFDDDFPKELDDKSKKPNQVIGNHTAKVVTRKYETRQHQMRQHG